MKPTFFSMILSLSILFFAGCEDEHRDHGEHAQHEESHGHDHEHGEEEVRYEKGKGLEFSNEIIDALGIKMVKPEWKIISDKKMLKGRVISASPNVFVNVKLPLSQAETFKDYSVKGGKLVRFDKTPAEVSGLADLVYEIKANEGASLGAFISIELQARPRKILSLPSAAVLDGVNGKSVYVFRNGHFLRVDVKTGIESDGLVEIAEGLNEDDSVAATSIQQLWLTELRLTKGGGHSH